MRPDPLLTEYVSKEYGQDIRCLFHLPSGDPGRGGEHGENFLGVLQLRFGTSTQVEGLTERRGQHIRGCSPMILIEIVPHGIISTRFPGYPARTMLHGVVHHHFHPALSKNRTFRPGVPTTPSPSRLINC